MKIRRLRPTDILKIKKMIEYVDSGISNNLVTEGNFTIFPIDVLHELLPVNMRFLQESYVAVEDGDVLGLIGLIPDGKQKTRWKINRLILNTNSYEVGKQLIDFVVNKYGASGVETFITSIDEQYGEVIAIFKNACGFRSCTKVNIWEKEIAGNIQCDVNIKHLRDIRKSDAKMLQELEQQSLFPQYKMSLTKDISDFKFGIKNKIINLFRGFKVKRMVLENPALKSIEGYVLIMTRDNQTYWADVVLSLAYQDYYEDLLNYIIRYVNSQNSNAKLFLYDRKYYQSSIKLNEILEKFGFKIYQSYQVLVKDYWKAAKSPSEMKKSPIVIFPDITSPACNIVSKNY